MKSITLTFILLTTTISFAQDDKHPIDVQNIKCLETATPTTLGSINCEIAAVKAWKDEMEAILLLLKAKQDDLDVAMLEEAQAKWLSFHESNLRFYYAYYQLNYQGGTLARAAAVSFDKRQIRERTLYLKDFYEELE